MMYFSTIYNLVLLFFISIACNGQSTSDANDSLTLPIIYTGGPIITMEGDVARTVEAVVTRGDRIVYVGAFKEAQRRFKNNRHYDLEGKTLMPGFIEPHVHPSIAATVLPNDIIAPYDWQLPDGVSRGAQTLDEFRERLQESIANHEGQEELHLIWGYHQMWHGGLSREILNDLAADQPVGIIHRSFHEIYLNDAAITLLGIAKDDFNDNHQVDWDKGHFYEGGWLALVPKIAGALFSPAKLQEGVSLMDQLIRQNGITTIAEPGFPTSNFFLEYGLYNMLMREDAGFDLYSIANGTRLYHSKGGHEGARTFIEQLEKYNTDNIRFLPRQVKLFADGAMYSQLMQMQEGYEDGHEGEWMTSLDLLQEQIEYYWNHDYKIHIHANGDLGIQRLIEIVKSLKRDRDFDHRLTLHHMAYFTPGQAEEMKELGMEASVNPYYLWALSDKYGEEGLGKDRAEYLVRTKTLIDRGIPVSFHSDFSMAPLSPLTLAWVAVNRVTSSGKQVSPEERISVYDALRAITINAARTLNLEDQIGSIAIDKLANLVVLEEDPLSVPPMHMKDIKIFSTIFQGREHIRHKKESGN